MDLWGSGGGDWLGLMLDLTKDCFFGEEEEKGRECEKEDDNVGALGSALALPLPLGL